MLEETLKTLGVKKVEFARAVGARPESVSRWIKRRTRPTGEHLAGILRTLNSPEHLARLNRSAPITFEELFGQEAA